MVEVPCDIKARAEGCMFPPTWYVQYTCYIYDVCTRVFSGSVRAYARIVLVHIRHTQRGQLIDSACIARKKKHLASRLARSLRSQPVINKGLNTPT